MKNKGLFSTLFIEEIKQSISLDDTAQGRMATLAQTWRDCDDSNVTTLWETFMMKAMSYLEFVTKSDSKSENIYQIFDDWGYSNCIGILYLIELNADIDDTSIGRFWPGKLIVNLKNKNLNWGILSNGSIWRLYSVKSSRPFEDYVELDLTNALLEDDEAEYGLFERFFHIDSFVPESKEGAEENINLKEAEGVYKCRLDRDREASEAILEERVKNPLLSQIDEVLQYICNGFIFDTPRKGDEYTEDERNEIFESAVKLLYRCLFLFYADSRRLLPSDPDKVEIYNKHSIHALCIEARNFQWGARKDTDGHDLWQHFKGLISAVNDGDAEYGIMGYNGGLFDDEREKFLRDHKLRNDFISRALYLLSYVEPYDNDQSEEYKIPYEDLEVRHLGELYENILEYKVILADADRYRRRTRNGVNLLLASETQRQQGDTVIKKGDVFFGETALERKQTGSYYTPESLVRFLNEKTVIKPLKDKFENEYKIRFYEFITQALSGSDKSSRQGGARSAVALVERYVKEVVLEFKACDPAMGSGHFLVDLTNQMAGLIVELFIEIPAISSIDYHISSDPNYWRRKITRHCIYGVDLNPLSVNLARLSLWLNCFASEHKLTFLDHHLRCGNSLMGIISLDQIVSIPKRKKEKKKKEDKQLPLFDYDNFSTILSDAKQRMIDITEMDEDDTDSQKSALDEVVKATSILRPLADLYIVYLMDSDFTYEDYKTIFRCLAQSKPVVDPLNPNISDILEVVEMNCSKHRFYHWPLEFLDVFGPGAVGGFSATVGNPPWDIVKPNSQEFFSDYDIGFRSYKKQEAIRISKKLMENNPAIAKKWQGYCKGLAEQSAYFKEPLSYSALGKGDINTFKLFLEQFSNITTDGGHLGIIVPSGIYTDKGCQLLRQHFIEKCRIIFLYCFENKCAIFNIHRSYKFVLFSVQKGGKTNCFKCAFMEHRPERLPSIEANALKMDVNQIRKFSPDTLGVMEFKNQQDIDVTEKIYSDWPLFGDILEDAWNVKFRRELDMTNNSHLFKANPTNDPLYEGKMIWHFDSAFEEPRYWLDYGDVQETLGKNAWEGNHYRVGFRNIGRNTDSRTLICGVIPPSFHGNSFPTISPYGQHWNGPKDYEMLFIASILSSFSIDFVIRQKVSANINFFYIETLPVPRSNQQIGFSDEITMRALRLFCCDNRFVNLWEQVFNDNWNLPSVWYPDSASINNYGPAHEQEIRQKLRDEANTLKNEWSSSCGVYDRLNDRKDIGNRAQLRAEIDAYVAHLYGLNRGDFSYILDTFPVLKRKEEAAFGEFMSKRKCLEEYDRIATIL